MSGIPGTKSTEGGLNVVNCVDCAHYERTWEPFYFNFELSTLNFKLSTSSLRPLRYAWFLPIFRKPFLFSPAFSPIPFRTAAPLFRTITSSYVLVSNANP